MTPEMLTRESRAPDQPIAPWWHTVAVLLLLAAWATAGHAGMKATFGRAHWVTYISSIMTQWMLLGSCVAGVYGRREFFARTLRQNARRWPVEALRGVGLYLGMIFLFALSGVLVKHTARHPGFDSSRVHALAPSNGWELLLWTGVCISAGFCEEHVFRGYLLRQAIAWGERLGISRVAAMLLGAAATSALFGSLHLYEGLGGAMLISVMGFAFCLVSQRLGNLRVVILAHVLQDFMAAAILMSRHASK